jgi:hypothetical protein
MGTKNPKSKFQKLYALLSDQDLFEVQWPAAVNAAQTADDLNMLAALVSNDTDRLDDLFYPRYRMVSDVDGMIALATAYPEQRDVIVRLVSKIQPCEVDILRLVAFHKGWTSELLADLLESKTVEYNKAIDRLTEAEDARDHAEYQLGLIAAETVDAKDKAAEIARNAQIALNTARRKVQQLGDQRHVYEEASVAYVQVTQEVDDLGLQVTDLTKQLNADDGEIAALLPDIPTADIMIAERFRDAMGNPEDNDLDDLSLDEPVLMAEEPHEPLFAHVEDVAAQVAPRNTAPVASDSWLVRRLRALRPQNVIRRVNSYLDAA